VAGFTLRAILAASDGAKENGGIVIAEMIFFTLGFVGLLYSVFILILDRSILCFFFCHGTGLIPHTQWGCNSASTWRG
jgi:hypothetical protein